MTERSQHDHPLWQLLDQMQMDLRQLSARMVELRAKVAALDLPEPVEHRCQCGSSFASLPALQEHAYHHHDGPLPEAWVIADGRAGDSTLTRKENAA